MRKTPVIIVLLFLAVNYNANACANCISRSSAIGEDGFSAGINFSFEGVNADNRIPSLRGMASYGQSFLGGVFNIYSELNYNLSFPKRLRSNSSQSNSFNRSTSRCAFCDWDIMSGLPPPWWPDQDERWDPESGLPAPWYWEPPDIDEPWWWESNPAVTYERIAAQSVYLNLMIGYNLFLGYENETTLSFILQNEIDEFIISPTYDGFNNLKGVFTPSVRFNHEFNTGDFYSQISAPITYFQYVKNAGMGIDLNFILGWHSLYGLEFEAALYAKLAPETNAGLNTLILIVGYKLDAFHFSVDAYIPLRNFDNYGFSITPQIDYTLKHWTFYINCAFFHIGAGSGNIYISPALGVKFKL